MAPHTLQVDGTRLRDGLGREVTLRGINVDASAKFPRHPHLPSHEPNGFFDPDISFVDRPFKEDEAPEHLARLKRWGYNTIRYVFTWEAIEHRGPGVYDEEFIDHTIRMLRLCKEYGFYVFMDPHQDVWSRFTGGSGAPLWTLYACGLNPEAFSATRAAVVHNTWPEPHEYPKMLWPTNYTRLAAETMFTLFYAGRDFAPNAVIDGKNIQDYLTDHFIGACAHLAQRIHEAGGLEDECVIGWETMNEPNRGLIGWEDLDVLPDSLKMKKGTMPTPWQSLLTGSGRAVEVDVWDFGSFGPSKSGRELVDPAGVSAWLPADFDDSRFGWTRDPGWKLGQCLWAQNGVWDPAKDQLLRPDYFSRIPQSGAPLDCERFTNLYFLHHFRKYRDAIRAAHKNAIILLQSAVLELPPKIRDTADDDRRLIFASHYYDGLTLLTKHWNKWYNFDVFGFMRGKYSSPMFAIKVGEAAIRKSLREQLQAIRLEAQERTGEHPVMFTEIGIPYDMDDGQAYRTGNFTSQVAAMDANHFALEGSGASGYTLWTYVASNNHRWGDNWNGEDLSIFSVDDSLPPSKAATSSLMLSSTNASTLSLDKGSDVPYVGSSNNNSPVIGGSGGAHTPVTEMSASSQRGQNPGLRAAEAFIRPSPIATVGQLVSSGFDLRNSMFTMTVRSSGHNHNNSGHKSPAALAAAAAAASAGPGAGVGPGGGGGPDHQGIPTEIYLPDFHFPQDKASVRVSSGQWRIDTVNVGGGGGETMQVMKWWPDHTKGASEHTLTVVGVKTKLGAVAATGEDGEYGDGDGDGDGDDDDADDGSGYYYFEMMQRLANNCTVM